MCKGCFEDVSVMFWGIFQGCFGHVSGMLQGWFRDVFGDGSGMYPIDATLNIIVIFPMAAIMPIVIIIMAAGGTKVEFYSQGGRLRLKVHIQ